MPFLTLNNDWSSLASLYNQNFNNKPEVPKTPYSSFDDGLIRGGVINTGLASAKDTVRIGKFFASTKGALFVVKQAGLQAANPQLESLGTIKKIPSKVDPTKLVDSIDYKKNNPTRTYLGLNTLLQVPINALGGHIIRHGFLPVGGVGFLENSTDNIDGYNYEKIVKTNNAFSLPPTKVVQSDNTKGHIIATSENYNKSETLENITVIGGGAASYKLAPNRLLQHLWTIAKQQKESPYGQRLLQSYNGGANSAYGLGRTEIKTSIDQRTNSTPLKDDPKYSLNNGFKPFNYLSVDINGTKLSSTVDRQSTKESPKDLITQDIAVANNITSNYPDYNIEQRIGVSRIGKSIKRSVDSINAISIMPGSTFYNWAAQATTPNSINSNSTLFTYTTNTDGKANGGSFGRDIIKFRIEFINNDSSNGDTDMLVFRAYIDDFNDGMSAKWNSYRYMGRGEDFYVYDGFTRDISISFTIHAHSPEEMKPLYQKLNYLMSTFTPDYSSKLKMRGNIAKLTVGDYLYQQPGIFTDIKLSGFMDTHWEIGMDEPEGGDASNQYEVPKHIKVSLSFKPIHNFLPRRVTADNPNRAPFITRNDVNNKYLTVNPNKQAPQTQEQYDASLKPITEPNSNVLANPSALTGS